MATLGQKSIPRYYDDETAFAHSVLCPRYAENDPAFAPPSPASIESFDALDSVPWRGSYIGSEASVHTGLQKRCKSSRGKQITILLLLACLVTGCGVITFLMVKHGRPQMN